jgi:hypothetical protein
MEKELRELATKLHVTLPHIQRDALAWFIHCWHEGALPAEFRPKEQEG